MALSAAPRHTTLPAHLSPQASRVAPAFPISFYVVTLRNDIFCRYIIFDISVIQKRVFTSGNLYVIILTNRAFSMPPRKK